MDKGVMTKMLVNSLGEDASTCVNFYSGDDLFVYTVDWILLEPHDESVKTLRRSVSQTPSRNFTCDFRGLSSNIRGGSTVPTGPVLFSRACVERHGEPLIGKHSQLRNTVIRAACIDLPHLRPANNKPNCNSYQTDIIFEAIKFYNVTVRQSFYQGSILLVKDMFKGLIDVHRNIAAAVPSALRRCSAKEVSNSFMFLLASFYSTSYSIPRIGRWSRSGGLVCGFWLIGMLPFSNYFRGELTSRVTLRSPPDHMDTLVKLEQALDKKRVFPCVVKDTFMHQRLVKNRSLGNIHAKLRLAFQTHMEQAKLIKSSYSSCLGCALRDDRVCYIVSLPSWFNHPYKRMIIESKEHFSPMLLTFAVRKNYPHKVDLRELVRKIIEAGLMRPTENNRRSLHLRKFDERRVLELSPLKLEELASFLLLLMALLAFAAVVCALEIIVRDSINLTQVGVWKV
ncbi:hypothetical protein MTO96_051055 [Rhipicephalus appendiculatus]